MSKALRNETDVEKAQLTQHDRSRERKLAGESPAEEPLVLDEICVEELAIDGICGVY